ncbi:hypothetical protein ACFV4K_25825 [Nocardia sp. NPDC059764]|uniref:hypothetical protein n=1 Tax=Nocardia sp. NPDC059764 TaxID=3346939 RepID=UPI00366585F0
MDESINERLQADAYTTLVFEPKPGIGWENEVAGVAKILQGVIALLQGDMESSGLFDFYYSVIVLEKKRNLPLVVDPRLLDPEDLNNLGLFFDVLQGISVESLDQEC